MQSKKKRQWGACLCWRSCRCAVGPDGSTLSMEQSEERTRPQRLCPLRDRRNRHGRPGQCKEKRTQQRMHDAQHLDVPLQLYRSTRAYWPREWDGDFENGYDVGLVRLDRRAPFERPQIDRTGHRLRTGDPLTAAVWGSQEEDSTVSVAQSAARLPFVSLMTCEEKLETRLEDSVMCTGPVGIDSSRGGRSVCQRLSRVSVLL